MRNGTRGRRNAQAGGPAGQAAPAAIQSGENPPGPGPPRARLSAGQAWKASWRKGRLKRSESAAFPKDPSALATGAYPAPHPQSPANAEAMRQMRASVLVMGPLLARTGEAVVSLPGGWRDA